MTLICLRRKRTQRLRTSGGAFFVIKYLSFLYTTTMKASFKSVTLFLTVLLMTLSVLVAIDSVASVETNTSDTYLRVTVMDLGGNPVHNAQVTVDGATFLSDNKGLSPSILLTDLRNVYDSSVTQWHTVNVIVKKDGYVPAVVLNCVVYQGQTRRLMVKIYPDDGSDLPYVCYVESPPHEYLEQLIGN